MDPKRNRIANMKNKFAIAVTLALLMFAPRVEAVKLGLPAKSYKALSSLANMAVEQGEALAAEGTEGLVADATLEQLDRFLASSAISDLYQAECKAIMDGPGIFAISSPKRVGSRMIIGFTEETNINADRIGEELPIENGRYLFYWDEKALRASLYKSKNFDELATVHGIDPNNAVLFSFPELRKLIAAGPPPPPSGDSSHLPKGLLEAIQADAKAKGYIEEESPPPQSSSAPGSTREQNPLDGTASSQEEVTRFPWKLSTIGLLLVGLVAWIFFSIRSK